MYLEAFFVISCYFRSVLSGLIKESQIVRAKMEK